MTTTSDIAEEGSSSLSNRLEKLRQKRLLFVFFALPYLIGVTWHGLHPFVSVFTGEDKPRRLYVDENSAEPYYFRVNHAKFKRRDQLIPKRQGKQVLPSLCRAVKAATTSDAFSLDRGNLQCRNINQALDVLQITPIEGPIAVRSEAIVFVLPASADWLESPVHTALLSFLVELLQPQFNWLAKTFFVVAPKIRDGQVLDVTQTVNVFLEAYLGPSSDTDQDVRELIGGSPAMPHGMTSSALLRQLIVWDQELVTESSKGLKFPSIRLLPQGPRGLLPNMDLVSVVRAALQRAVSSNAYFEIHPYQEKSHEVQGMIDAACKIFTSRPCPERHLSAFLNLLWFEHAMRGHDFRAPHAVALERGIDALTVQFVSRPLASNDIKTRNASSKLPAAMEICLRALSNLHERLHHSTSLYLLLDMDKFVKHEEYLVPNLLLLIPLILRAATLFLLDLEQFDWTAAGLVAERTLLATVFISCGLEALDFIEAHSWWILDDGVSARHAVVGLAYLHLVWRLITAKEKWSTQAQRSVQFLACLCGLYTHVTDAFGHVAMAFPSALLWTPLIAFPFFRDRPHLKTTMDQLRYGVSRLVGPVTFLVLVPFIVFVPHVLQSYTPYVCYTYIPLHLILSHLWLS